MGAQSVENPTEAVGIGLWALGDAGTALRVENSFFEPAFDVGKTKQGAHGISLSERKKTDNPR